MSWGGSEALPGTSSLADDLDRRLADKLLPFVGDDLGFQEKLLVVLRDGRKLIGVLRSFDQFANIVLEGAIERIIVGEIFCDLPLGLYVVRGENVVLIGTLQDTGREELPAHMVHVSPADIRRAQKAEDEALELKGTLRKRMTEFLDMD